MAQETVIREIDGRTYEFTQFGTTLSLKLLARLTKIIGEPLAIALGGLKTPPGKKVNLADMDVSGDLLGKAVKALIDRLDENEVVALVKTLASEHMLCDNAKIIFDAHYSGNMGHLLHVLMASLEVQYGNFFAGWSDRVLSPSETTVESKPPEM